ncbi:MAG TPA: hypothetical protein VFM82_00345 [Flavobacteriaceae bacterium]|nr:hypothetical protein [Flavobacteriaceae bacterium]
MKNLVLRLSVLSLLFFSCQKERADPFLIGDSSVGPLTKKTQIRQLDSLYPNDSVVIKKTTGVFGSENEIFIYDKNGSKLLRLDPVQNFDSTSAIGNIQIIDPRFKTKEGFGPESTFKDIVANYHISRIENTLNALVIFIDEINAYVTIDKKELPNDINADEITAAQIPPNTEITYFWIGWQ